MSGQVTVRGGFGGVAAELDDMRAAAGRLRDTAAMLATIAGRVRGIAADGDLLASAVLAPATAALAEGALLAAADGPGGLLGLGVRSDALALVLTTRAGLMEAADSGHAFAADALQRVAGGTLGRLVLSIGLPLGAAWFSVETGQEAAESLFDLARGDLALAELDDRLAAAPGAAFADMGEEAARTLFELPWLTDLVAGGAPELLAGVAAPFPSLRRYLPADYAGVVALLLTVGHNVGALRDTPVAVRPVGLGAVPAPAILGLRSVLASQADLVDRTRGDPTGSRVRVVKVTHVHGRPSWIVQVPGTQEWGLAAGADPSDLTTNLELMDDGKAALLDAIAEAMRQAGVGPDEPVLLSGHSQGGIAALAFAADPRWRSRFSVTHVITAGAPVAHLQPPGDLRVLSLEHTQDPVPRLDGDPNPDTPYWTTVTADATGATAPIEAHLVPGYLVMAAELDHSTDPSVLAFRQSAASFFTGGDQVQDYAVERPRLPR